jgi:hypothetical protein
MTAEHEETAVIAFLAALGAPWALKLLLRVVGMETAEKVVESRFFGWGVLAVILTIGVPLGYGALRLAVSVHDAHVVELAAAKSRAAALQKLLDAERAASKSKDDQLSQRAAALDANEKAINALITKLKEVRDAAPNADVLVFRANDPWLQQHRASRLRSGRR